MKRAKPTTGRLQPKRVVLRSPPTAARATALQLELAQLTARCRTHCTDEPAVLDVAPLADLLLYGLGKGALDPVATVLASVVATVEGYLQQLELAEDVCVLGSHELDALRRRLRVAIELHRRQLLVSRA